MTESERREVAQMRQNNWVIIILTVRWCKTKCFFMGSYGAFAKRGPCRVCSLFYLGGCGGWLIKSHNGFIKAAVVFAEKLTKFDNRFPRVGYEPAPARIAESAARYGADKVVTSGV